VGVYSEGVEMRYCFSNLVVDPIVIKLLKESLYKALGDQELQDRGYFNAGGIVLPDVRLIPDKDKKM
jgi:hypothetical protein